MEKARASQRATPRWEIITFSNVRRKKPSGALSLPNPRGSTAMAAELSHKLIVGTFTRSTNCGCKRHRF